MISEVRSLIRHILLEDAIDVVEVEARIRIKHSKRNVSDVITDIRGIEKVVTVSQVGAIQDAEDGKQRILALIKFERDEDNMTLNDIQDSIKAIPEVDMITITSYDGEPMRNIA